MLIRISFTNVLVMGLLSVSMTSCIKEKTAYVDVYKLVEGFDLQKEYTEQAKLTIDREKAMIDSLLYIEGMNNPARKLELQNELYTRLYQKVENQNVEIEKIIWNRLNPYLVEYGKKHGYTYIFGANGTGTILYADESENITEDLIKYVNERYHDKK